VQIGLGIVPASFKLIENPVIICGYTGNLTFVHYNTRFSLVGSKLSLKPIYAKVYDPDYKSSDPSTKLGDVHEVLAAELPC